MRQNPGGHAPPEFPGNSTSLPGSLINTQPAEDKSPNTPIYNDALPGVPRGSGVAFHVIQAASDLEPHVKVVLMRLERISLLLEESWSYCRRISHFLDCKLLCLNRPFPHLLHPHSFSVTSPELFCPSPHLTWILLRCAASHRCNSHIASCFMRSLAAPQPECDPARLAPYTA